jgi:hypothetical protein
MSITSPLSSMEAKPSKQISLWHVFTVTCTKVRTSRGLDPTTGLLTALFHPRANVWKEHFEWNRAVLFGRTAIGRATIQTLALNAPALVAVRLALIDEEVFPNE